jgi:hypothetical protein
MPGAPCQRQQAAASCWEWGWRVAERAKARPDVTAARMNRREQIEAVCATLRHAPQPEQVGEGRDRSARGDRLPDDREARPWYCRSCGHSEQALVIPAGWYSPTRHSGDRDVRPARLGVYCSAECLNAQMPRIIGVEADAGDRWVDALERRS